MIFEEVLDFLCFARDSLSCRLKAQSLLRSTEDKAPKAILFQHTEKEIGRYPK